MRDKMRQINITEVNSATLLNKIITPLKNQSLLTDEDLTALQPYLEKIFKNIEISNANSDSKKDEPLITQKRFEKDEVLAEFNDTDTDEIVLVIDGNIRADYICENKKKKTITRVFVTEGYLALDEGLLGYDKRIYTWTAEQRTDVLSFSSKTYRYYLSKYPILKDLHIRILEGGIRYKIERINELLILDTYERFTKFMNDPKVNHKKISQKHLASYLGTSTRHLRRLSEEYANKTSN